MPRTRVLLALLLATMTTLLVASVSTQANQGSVEEPTPVHIYASDFNFVLDRTIIPAGPVEFEMLNLSDANRHEVWIDPIDERDAHRFHEMLDLKRTGQRASEPEFIEGIVARSGEVGPGESATFTADLPPGVYEVACLAREGDGDERMVHYDEGMYTVIAVRAPTGR